MGERRGRTLTFHTILAPALLARQLDWCLRSAGLSGTDQ